MKVLLNTLMICLLAMSARSSYAQSDFLSSRYTKVGAVCAAGAIGAMASVESTKKKLILSASICGGISLYEYLDYRREKSREDSEDETKRLLVDFINNSKQSIDMVQAQLFQEQVVFKDLMAEQVKEMIVSGNKEIFMVIKQDVMASYHKDKSKLLSKIENLEKRMANRVTSGELTRTEKELSDKIKAAEVKLSDNKLKEEDIRSLANKVMALLESDELYTGEKVAKSPTEESKEQVAPKQDKSEVKVEEVK